MLFLPFENLIKGLGCWNASGRYVTKSKLVELEDPHLLYLYSLLLVTGYALFSSGEFVL